MFERSAELYDALYSFKDYAGEAEQVRELIRAHAPHARSLLDVACGTGRHLASLRGDLDVEGLDVSEGMLAVASRRLPGVRLHRDDMASFDLGRTFDVVTCLFRSIAYVRTPDRMREATATMARHLAPGGALLLDPWFTPERYWVGHVASNVAETEEAKVSWMYSQQREGSVGVLAIHFLVGTAQGVEHFVERHEMGLFTHDDYLAALIDAGLTVERDPGDRVGQGPFVARREP